MYSWYHGGVWWHDNHMNAPTIAHNTTDRALQLSLMTESSWPVARANCITTTRDNTSPRPQLAFSRQMRPCRHWFSHRLAVARLLTCFDLIDCSRRRSLLLPQNSEVPTFPSPLTRKPAQCWDLWLPSISSESPDTKLTKSPRLFHRGWIHHWTDEARISQVRYVMSENNPSVNWRQSDSLFSFHLMVSCPIWVWQITDECCTTAVPLMPPGWSETGQLWSVITELYWGNTQHLGDWSVTASNISSVYALPLGFSTYPSLWLSKSDRGEQLQWDMTQGSLFSCHSFQRE